MGDSRVIRALLDGKAVPLQELVQQGKHSVMITFGVTRESGIQVTDTP